MNLLEAMAKDTADSPGIAQKIKWISKNIIADITIWFY